MKFINVITLFILSIIIPVTLNASVSSGTIDPSNKNALVCHSVDCTTPAPGVINFMPTGGTPVTIDDANGIDGVAWGNEIGWINFDPTGAEGVTIDPATGVISGKAWSQVSGWVNFSVTGQSVSINANGEFTGYAWTGGPNGGWIRFDCSFAGACVKTDWRPTSARPATSGGGGGSAGGAGIGSTSGTSNPSFSENDMCVNIEGVQSTVPTNYAKDEGGICVLDVDYCKNIEGKQLTIPNKYVLNGSGQCILLTKDNQSEYVPDPTDTTTEYTDFCPNLFGVQSQLPSGYAMYEGTCVPEESDYCPNIIGSQYDVPSDMKISSTGECVKMTPEEVQANNNAAVGAGVDESAETGEITHYPFIPDMFLVPISLPFLDNPVDLMSIVFTLVILTLIALAIRVKFFI